VYITRRNCISTAGLSYTIDKNGVEPIVKSKNRKETTERVFAEGKKRHRLRYATMRGLVKITMQVTLIFACMNLKKIALWKKEGRDTLGS